MFRARAIKYILLGLGAALLLVLLALALPSPSNGDLQISDPGLHILRADVSIGTHHSIYGPRWRSAIHDFIYWHAPARVTMRMDPSLEAETKDDSVAFVLYYRRDGLADALTGELSDRSGHTLPLRTAGMFRIGHGPPGSQTRAIDGGLILMLDQPPTNGGNYELALHSVGTNVVVATWKIHLPAMVEGLPLTK